MITPPDTISNENNFPENPQSYIGKYKTQHSELVTFRSMGAICGNYDIPPEELHKFIEHYADPNYCFIEVKQPQFKLFFDFDIVNNQLKDDDLELIYGIGDEKLQSYILKCVMRGIKYYFGNGNNEYQYIYSIKWNYIKKCWGNQYKVHLYFPNIILDSQMALTLRKYIINILQHKKYPELRNIWDCVVDDSIFKANGLRLLYQPKKNEQEQYVINERRSTYPIPSSTIGKLQVTSINPVAPIDGRYKCELIENRIFDDEIEQLPKKTIKQHNSKPIIHIDNIKVEYPIEYIRALCDNLSIKRLTAYTTWIRVMMFCRNHDFYDIAHEISLKAQNYNKQKIDEIFSQPPKNYAITISSLQKWSREDNPTHHKEILKQFKFPLVYNNLDDILRNRYTHVNYTESSYQISDEAFKQFKDKTHILLESGTGSGKTYRTNEMLKQYPNMSALSITSLKTLALTHANAFTDFVCYLHSPKREHKKYIISLKQLWTIKTQYDIIILDEISNLFEHLYSKTMNDCRRKSYNRLLELMKNAKMVICADATIRDDVMSQLDGLFGDKLFVYKNTCKRSENVDVTIHYPNTKLENIDNLINYIKPLKTKIENNKSVCVVCDSKKQCDIIKEIMSKWNKNDGYIKVFTSSCGKLDDIMDCNNTFKKHCVIFSPKIVYGVDIQLKYKIDTIYCVYKGNSISASNMYQQIGRFRNATNIHVMWLEKNYKNKINSYISFGDSCWIEKQKFKKYAQMIGQLDDGMSVCSDLLKVINGNGECVLNEKTLFAQYHFYRAYYHRLFSYNKNQLLCDLLHRQGYKIKHVNIEDDTVNKIDLNDLQTKVHKKDVLDAIGYVDQTLNINDEVFDSVKDKVSERIKYLVVTPDEVKQNEQLKHLITDDKIFNDTLKGVDLCLTKDELKKKYCKKYGDAKKIDTFGFIEMNCGIENVLTVEKLEKLCMMRRFDIENIKGIFDDIVKGLFGMKEEIAKVLYDYPNLGVKTKIKRFELKLDKIRSIEHVRTLMVDIYNKFGDIFMVNTDKTHIDNSTVRLYGYVLSETNSKNRELLLRCLRKKYESTKIQNNYDF